MLSFLLLKYKFYFIFTYVNVMDKFTNIYDVQLQKQSSCL